MANTQDLLKIVEPELKRIFLEEYNVTEIEDCPKKLLNTQPDVVGYKKNNILVLGEITVSGFRGYKDKDFHLGATRKLAESFLKLYILKNRKKELSKILNRKIDGIQIYFIYPEGSRFMNALGYREYIFNLDLNDGSVIISKELEEKIDEVLCVAKEEIAKVSTYIG